MTHLETHDAGGANVSATDAYRAARDQVFALRGHYDRAVQEFAWPRFGGSFNWAVDWFGVIAEGNDQEALVIVEEDESVSRYTYAEMLTRSNQVAAWLSAQGVAKGDPVIVMLGNQVELWETLLAVMKLGAILMPTASAAYDVEERITRTGAKHVICNAADIARFGGIPQECTRVCVGSASGWLPYRDAYEQPIDVSVPHPETMPDDPLLYYFTSGTTSRPKLVEHTQSSYPVGHLSTTYWLGLQRGDVHLNISSPGWAKHAWSCFFAPWIAEATILVYNYSRFDAAALLRQLRAHEVTTFCAPPTVWRMLIKADLSCGAGSLRELIGAGEPLNPEVIGQVKDAWGIEIRDGFGQTETTAQVGNPPGVAVKIGSMGRALPGVPVVLVDPVAGTPVEAPGEGEICLDLAQQPINLMVGYKDDAQKNADAIAGGYYHTGDIASLDQDGYITFVGRTDDVFKASDYKISPFELESVLIEHPAVLEAAVVPAPDPVRLAVPKAYVTLAEGYEANAETAASVLAYAREHLASYQRVRRIEFCDLPKTISGKIRRVELRARERDNAGAQEERSSLEWRDTDFP